MAAIFFAVKNPLKSVHFQTFPNVYFPELHTEKCRNFEANTNR